MIGRAARPVVGAQIELLFAFAVAADDRRGFVDELVVLNDLHREQAKSTRRVLLLSRIGSPTCQLVTGRPLARAWGSKTRSVE